MHSFANQATATLSEGKERAHVLWKWPQGVQLEDPRTRGFGLQEEHSELEAQPWGLQR